MITAQRSQPETAVGFGVYLAADPEMPSIEEPECRGQHSLLAEALLGEVLGNQHSGIGQRGAETHNSLELQGVSPGRPISVVQVLFPTGGIDPRRLDMSVRPGRNPNSLP